MKRTGELRFSTFERKMWGKLSYVKYDWSPIDQSYEHPADIFRTALGMLFYSISESNGIIGWEKLLPFTLRYVELFSLLRLRAISIFL